MDTPHEDDEHYLAWLKGALMAYNQPGLCNFALSGATTKYGKKWLSRTLRRRKELLELLNVPAEYGLPQLKQALSAHFGVQPPHELLLMTGGSRAIARTYETLLASFPHCEIAVETPTYGPLVEIPKRLRAKVLRFRRDHLFEDLPQLLGDKTRAVAITNPSNPTSHFLTPEAQQRLLEMVVSRAKNALLLIDQSFGGSFSIQDFPIRNHPRVVVINSLSKSYGGRLNLLRTGTISACRRSFADLFKDWSLFENSGCRLSEAMSYLAAPFLPLFENAVGKHLERNAEVAQRWIDKRSAEGVIEPSQLHHGTVCFLRLTKIKDTDPFVVELANERQVLVAPGGFFEDRPSNAIRVGIGGNKNELKRGLAALKLGLRERSQG
jgi:aspartate/methionine/tyrosine aminotransferase